tara:strand:- start:10462 stop:10791 length:330 start_codon:yes stop_codon:yes gene_type:complete
MDIFEEYPDFKNEDFIYDWCASMDVMYEIVTSDKTFEEFLLDHTAIYTSNNSENVEVNYASETQDFIVYPFDPTDIRKEDLEDLLEHFEEREEYEKCIEIKKEIDKYGK